MPVRTASSSAHLPPKPPPAQFHTCRALSRQAEVLLAPWILRDAQEGWVCGGREDSRQQCLPSRALWLNLGPGAFLPFWPSCRPPRRLSPAYLSNPTRGPHQATGRPHRGICGFPGQQVASFEQPRAGSCPQGAHGPEYNESVAWTNDLRMSLPLRLWTEAASWSG